MRLLQRYAACLSTAVLIILFSSSFSSLPAYINPTGTYNLVSKIIHKGEDDYGYSGQIQVKRISRNRIAMTFGINKGAPSYSSGSFIDTLTYSNNQAVYFNKETDSTCRLYFTFTTKGVTVREDAQDFNTACGFGHAVVADGYFKKVSARVPVLRDPLTGELVSR